MRKVNVGGLPLGSAVDAKQPPPGMAKFPGWWEHLVSESYDEGGGPREPGSVTFFAQAGVLKACINEKTQSAVCFVTADDLVGLLKCVEKVLVSGEGDWRASKPGRRR